MFNSNFINELYNEEIKSREIFNEYSIGQVFMGLKIHPHQNLDKTLKTHQYPGFLNFVKKTNKIEDLNYLRQDVHQGINDINKIKNKIKNKDQSNKWVKKGITVKDCDLTIQWFKEVVLKEISNKIKELKEK